jgi:inhibitor of KinA sporulation pathway (predicted exonuclease)
MIGSENLCFADFEFTCGFYNDKALSELLSVGLVICDSSYNIIKTFYRTSRPNIYRKLTKQCRKLTKLSQDEIDASPDSDDVMGEVLDLLRSSGVRTVGVWGNFDRPALTSDIRQHKRAGRSSANVAKVLGMVKDIQSETIRKMQLPQAINIKDLASAFDYVPATGAFHNALTDALALYTVHKAVYTTDIYECRKFVELKQQRLDKMESDKQAAEKRRQELTMMIPFTEKEKAYFGSLVTDAEKNDYLKLRFRIMNIFQRSPEEEKFRFVVLHSPRRVKLCPETRYSLDRYQGADVRTFGRENFDELLIAESKRKQLLTN